MRGRPWKEALPRGSARRAVARRCQRLHILALTLSGVLALAACGDARQAAPPTVAAVQAMEGSATVPGSPAPATAASASSGLDALHERGRAIYNFRCYFCHGYSGDAKTLAASYLEPRPRDFRAAVPAELPLERIALAVRDGRDGTAMRPFRTILSAGDIAAVSGFVAREFVRDKAVNTAYHTAANGWPDHARYAAAFPFARGEVALDASPESLSAAQVQGRQLFMRACVTCHDRARADDAGPAWSSRPVSFPRMGFVPGQPNTPPAPDAISRASVYARHEVPPALADLSALERRGETLFQTNCAFCHAGDGSGKNWIGQFMEPKARDLTQYTAQTMPRARLREVILDGLPGTSMPAWRAVLQPAEVDAVAAYVMRAFFRQAEGSTTTATATTPR